MRASAGGTVATSGSVISDRHYTGDVLFTGDRLTLRNVRVTGNAAFRGDNIVVEDSELGALTLSGTAGVQVRRVEISGTPGHDGIHVTSDTGRASDVLIEDTWVHSPAVTATSHYDGIQVRGVDRLTLRRVSMDLGPWQRQYNAAVFLEAANGGNRDVTLEGSRFIGGGYTLYSFASRVSVRGTVFGGGRWGHLFPSSPACSITEFTGNRDTAGAALVVGLSSAGTTIAPVAGTTTPFSPVSTQRLGGSDRFSTAVALGRAAFPSGTTAVLVNGLGGSVVDGLVAAPFARAKGAPVLLATRDEVPAATMAELTRRGARTVWLVGGEGVLGPRVVARLRDKGITVHRVAGADRFDTAAAVARAMGPSRTAFFASGDQLSLIDSAAVGGVAAALDAPILLVSRDRVPATTRAAVRNLGVRSGWVIGGSGVISQTARGQLTGVSTTRLGGADRYGTATAVAGEFAGDLGTDTVLLAGGGNAQLIDSLAGGVLGHVTLLTGPKVPPPTAAWFAAHDVALIRVAGGTGAVPSAALATLGGCA